MSVNSSKRSARSTSRNFSPDIQFEDVPTPIVAGPKRTQRAKDYEEKIEGLLNVAMRTCAGNPATVADAATILVHGPVLASKTGDLADADPRVRHAIDLITAGSENPYVALALAALPLATQLLRNHEAADLNGTRKVQLKIPFTRGKRTIGINLRFKLRNPFLRSMTVEPRQISQAAFGNPAIAEALKAQGVEVAWSSE